MPTYPDDAVQRAAEVMLRQYESQYSAEHLTWRDFADPAREVLDAAAPLFADEVARKILAHMKERDPLGWPGTTWRRYFRIAAQVASRAFSTREDELRAVADAVMRGEYIHCNPEAAMLAAAESDGLLPDALPEDGVPRD